MKCEKNIGMILKNSELFSCLLEYLIKTYTNEGELVLDNCIGSGSTAVAAINTNRRFIGFETDAGYCEIANKRITEALDSKSQVLFD